MKITPFRGDIQQEYKNPFKEQNIYPFNMIKRVACDKDTGEIKYTLGELDSTVDSKGNLVDFTNLDVYTYIPKFYIKREWEGDVLKDSILNVVPDDKKKKFGYEIHPAFIRSDGSVREYVLIGCFMPSIVNGQMRSIPETTNLSWENTIATYLSLARQGRTNNFTLTTIQLFNVIQILSKIGFNTLNIQTPLTKATRENGEKFGITKSLGNRTGIFGDKGIPSIFGIEGFSLNASEFIPNVMVTKTEYRLTNDLDKFLKNSEEWEIKIPHSMTQDIQEVNRTTAGVLKTIQRINNYDGKYLFLPKTLYQDKEGTINFNYSVYYCDAVLPKRDDKDDINLVLLGSYSDYGSGLFSMDTWRTATYKWGAHIGRLCYLP